MFHDLIAHLLEIRKFSELVIFLKSVWYRYSVRLCIYNSNGGDWSKVSVMLCLNIVAWFAVSVPTSRVPLGLHFPRKLDVVTRCAHTILSRTRLKNLHWHSRVSGCYFFSSVVTRRSARSDSLPVPASTAVLHYCATSSSMMEAKFVRLNSLFRTSAIKAPVVSAASSPAPSLYRSRGLSYMTSATCNASNKWATLAK